MKVDKYRVKDKKEVYKSYLNAVDKYFGDYRYTNKIKAFLKGIVLGMEISERSSEE